MEITAKRTPTDPAESGRHEKGRFEGTALLSFELASNRARSPSPEESRGEDHAFDALNQESGTGARDSRASKTRLNGQRALGVPNFDGHEAVAERQSDTIAQQ